MNKNMNEIAREIMSKNIDEIIREKLAEKFREAGSDRIEIEMKADGARFALEACSERSFDPNDISTIDFILVYGNGVAEWMSGSLDEVVKSIRDYDALKAEYDSQISRIVTFAEKHKDEERGAENEAWNAFSDWHKELFGHRPRNGWKISKSLLAS